MARRWAGAGRPAPRASAATTSSRGFRRIPELLMQRLASSRNPHHRGPEHFEEHALERRMNVASRSPLGADESTGDAAPVQHAAAITEALDGFRDVAREKDGAP